MLGIAVGVMAMFCIVSSFLLGSFPALESMRYGIAGALVVFGFGGWFHGFAKARKRAAQGGEARETWPLSDRRYLGIMLVLGGLITMFIQPDFMRKKGTKTAVPAPRPPTPAPVVVVAKHPSPAPARVPAKFPKLRFQGVFLKAKDSVVIIDGDSYRAGDLVCEGVKVKSVDRDGVILESAGETKTFRVD